jgi:hypothetical protein
LSDEQHETIEEIQERAYERGFEEGVEEGRRQAQEEEGHAAGDPGEPGVGGGGDYDPPEP